MGGSQLDSNNPSKDPYAEALAQLKAASRAYWKEDSVPNLIAYYEAENAVRQAAYSREASKLSGQAFTPESLKKTTEMLSATEEPVRGMYLAYAQALQAQIKQRLTSGGHAPGSTAALTDAYTAAEQYIRTATASIQEEDQNFAHTYTVKTGQPPPPGQFSNAQMINQTPTPSPITGVPDEGQRPQTPVTVGTQLPFSPSKMREDKTPPKRKRGTRQDQGIYIEPLPDYAPWSAKQEADAFGAESTLGPTGHDVEPGQPPTPRTNEQWRDSVEMAQRAAMNAVVPQGANTGVFKSGFWYGGNKSAMRSGSLVFMGYQTRNTKYIDESNPRLGSQITATKTPTYQSTAGLTYALGKEGFPNISAYQKTFDLPVTGRLDPATINKWNETVAVAAMNTAAGYPTTVQDAIQLQVQIAKDMAARQRAAMAASYKVDPTASAAILGSAMKQITGRLSNAGEDSEFHRAFNSANISTQGKVDAQQFARDWVRNKYPTEAGTMSGQDYYGAMYDVLTAGPGSLGSEAANING